MARVLRSLASALLAIAVLASPASPAAAGAALPKTLTEHVRRQFEVRPASISYTGDGTGFLGGSDGTGPLHPGHLRWTSYTTRAGDARGVDWLNDCDPDCADGTFTAVPVRVHVFRPRSGHFTRMTLRYRYHGHRTVDRRGVRRQSPGTWAYYIISFDG